MQAQGATQKASSGAGGESVRAYDFRQPNHISKDRLRAIEAKYGTMCKAVEGWVSTRVRANLELRLVNVEQMTFGEFTRQLGSPSASFVYNVANSGDQVVIDFGQDLAFFLVDRLLGSNDEPAIPARALTVLERMVVRIAADQVSSQLVAAWKDRVPLSLALDRFEAEPELLRAANRDDPMLVARVEVHANKLASVLNVCLPLTLLENFLTAHGSKHQLGRGPQADRSVDRRAAEAALRLARVELSVRTPAFGMLLSDLNRLQPGNVIRTGLAPDANLHVRIEGTPRFVAQPGRAERALAVRIIETEARQADARAETNGRHTMATIQDSGAKQPIDLAQLESTGSGSSAPLSHIFQISLPVTIELGRTRMAVQDVLDLGRGSVVVLDRLVGEPVDVIVGDRPFAEGEVVVIGEQFGVRITRIHATANGAAESK